MADELEAKIDAAEAAYLQGDFPAAMALAKQALKEAPGETSSMHILGCAAWAAGDLKTAASQLKKLATGCRKAIARAQSDEDRAHFEQILNTIGDDLVEESEGPARLRAARFLLEKAGVETPVALRAVANAAVNRGQMAEAARLLTRLVALNPKDAVLWYRLAAAHAKLRRKQPMLAALETSLGLDRSSVRALTDPAFARFRNDADLRQLCEGRVEPEVEALYALLEEAEFEQVIAQGQALLGRPLDTLAVLQAVEDALENLAYDGAKGLEALTARIKAQLRLLRANGAKSNVYAAFLERQAKDAL